MFLELACLEILHKLIIVWITTVRLFLNTWVEENDDWQNHQHHDNKKNNFINGLPLVDISVSVAMIESKSKPNVTFLKLKLKYYI